MPPRLGGVCDDFYYYFNVTQSRVVARFGLRVGVGWSVHRKSQNTWKYFLGQLRLLSEKKWGCS